MLTQFNESVKYIQSKTNVQPTIGIILGTGLGGLVKEIKIIDEIEYQDIPNFPVSTVESHSGKLIFGELGGKKVVAMQGRFHYYEGYDMKEVTFPVRVMKLLGIEKLFVSNASGGVNPDFEVGEIMIINDHINLFPAHPLIGKNFDELESKYSLKTSNIHVYDLKNDCFYQPLDSILAEIGFFTHDQGLHEYLTDLGWVLESQKRNY